MNKKAITKNNINELIANRWSPRSFNEKTINQKDIDTLFEAASWAASAFNEQPWRFIYATNAQFENYQKILSTLVEWNQQWAKSAPFLCINIVKEKFSHNDTLNATAEYDLGQAVANMTVQSTEMGLHAHQMSGFDADKARELFNIPQGYKAVSVIAIGHVGDPEKLSDDMKSSELAARTRKQLDEFVFINTFKV